MRGNEAEFLKKQLQEELLCMGLDEGDVTAVPPAVAQPTPADGSFVAPVRAASGLGPQGSIPPLLPKHGKIPEPPFWDYATGAVAMNVG